MSVIIKYEFKRAFCNRSMRNVVIFCALLCLFHTIAYVLFIHNAEYTLYSIVPDAWLGTEVTLCFHSLFYLILPIIAILPYGLSLYTDNRTGYGRMIMVKVRHGHYYLAKYIAVFCSSAFVVGFTLLLSVIMLSAVIPWGRPDGTHLFIIGGSGMFSEVFYLYPAWYMFFYTMLDMLFGGLFGVMALAVSYIAKNRFMVLSIPYMIYWMEWLLFTTFGFPQYSIFNIVDCSQQGGEFTLQSVVLVYMIFMGLATLLYCISVRKRDVL